MIDESNFKQVIFDFAREKYGKRFKEFYKNFYEEFPDKYENAELSNELHFKNFFDWLMIEKPLPDTNKTIVEEFVEQHSELNEDIKQKILQMKNIIRSIFVVLKQKQDVFVLEDTHTQQRYNIKLWGNMHLSRGNIIQGRIHPFGDIHRFAGAFLLSENSPFIFSTSLMMEEIEEKQIKKAENLILYPHSTFNAILNKYPSNWIDGICKKLAIPAKGKKPDKIKKICFTLQQNLSYVIKQLSNESKNALNVILKQGGFVKYSALKKYDDEMTFWWSEKPIVSPIGILRVYGLLIVGKMPFDSKLYRVAFVPNEIRDSLNKLLNGV